MSGMLTLFIRAGSPVMIVGSENPIDSTILSDQRSKNSKVQVASDRFVDLFKRVAGRKGKEKEEP